MSDKTAEARALDGRVNSKTNDKETVASAKRFWVINDDKIAAVIDLRNAAGKRDEMFVQAMSRAEIPPGFTYDRSTQAKYPRVRVVAI